MKSASTTRFDELYSRLNPEQKKAVDTIEGPVMVIAGPGTGKTQILTLRIANILKNTDTSPDNILALTFTESGVQAMRKRLVDIIGTAGYKVGISTFHGFANDVIKQYPESFPRIIGSNNATDIDQIQIMQQVLESLTLEKLKPYGDPLYYVRPLLGEIKHLKREDINPDALEIIIEKQQKDFNAIEDLYYEKGAYKGKMKGVYKDLEKHIEKNKELAQVYRAYEALLTEKKLFDFEDMIMEVVRAMKADEDLRLRLQEQYHYILADEHQDANQAQNHILEQLSSFHDNPNLFIVGDEKQAIYRFQGASLENFLYFKRLYPAATIVSLVHNYRSTQTILDAAHSLIENNSLADASLRVTLRAASSVGEKITVASFSQPEDEYIFLIEDIRKKINAGTKPEEIAVLFRNNNDVVPLVKALEKTDIPFSVESGKDLLADVHIQKLVLLMRAINELGNNNLLSDVLFIDLLKLDHLDVYKLVQHAKINKLSLYECISDEACLAESPVINKNAFSTLYNQLSAWSVAAKNKHGVEFFQQLVSESGYIEYVLQRKGSVEHIQKLEALYGEMNKGAQTHSTYRLADFIKYLDIITSHNISLSASAGHHGRGVRLMTAHRSKGLEFDCVYILGAADGHWSNKRSVTYFHVPLPGIQDDFDPREDERRLFYVALTRARTDITVTWSISTVDGKKDVLPTQFIEEIHESYKHVLDIPRKHTDLGVIPSFSFAPQLSYGLDISDKVYLQELFLSQGMAVTALNNYLECPWKWFFQNLVRLPQAQSKHQLYGTAMHETLKFFFDAYKREEDLSKEQLLETLHHNLTRKPFEHTDFLASLKKGTDVLSGYYDTYENTWQRNLFTEFTISGIPFIFQDTNGGEQVLLLRGQLDKIEIDNNDRVTVVDYKTKKPMSRNEIEGLTKNSDGAYKRQLVFYKLLLDHSKKQSISSHHMETGVIDFIEPDTKGEYKREAFAISEQDVEALEAVIAQTAQEIYNFDFWNNRCGKKDCEFCRMRTVMER